MRIKTVSLLGVLLIAVSSFTMFNVVYKVQNAYKDLQELQRQYVEEKKSLHVLKAEWSYLNQPERLKQMAAQYLQVQEIHMAQIESITLPSSAVQLASHDVPSSYTPALTQYRGE